MIKKGLIALINADSRILSIDDETDTGDGYWLYLEAGHIFDNDTHTIHEDTIAKLRESLKRVGPCNCKVCKAMKGN